MTGYVVVFEGDDTSGYSAYSPDLPPLPPEQPTTAPGEQPPGMTASRASAREAARRYDQERRYSAGKIRQFHPGGRQYGP